MYFNFKFFFNSVILIVIHIMSNYIHYSLLTIKRQTIPFLLLSKVPLLDLKIHRVGIVLSTLYPSAFIFPNGIRVPIKAGWTGTSCRHNSGPSSELETLGLEVEHFTTRPCCPMFLLSDVVNLFATK